LAMLELPRGLTPAELAGGFFAGTVRLSRSVEESFRRRLDSLPTESRRLVLVAAAEPVGEPLLVWRAAERLGIGAQAAAPAEEAGLLEFGARVLFRHPLVRSVAYRSAPVQDRQDVHCALAEVTDPELDPDRRAWHRAHAAPGPDEEVAVELELSAGRAHARGGLAAGGGVPRTRGDADARPCPRCPASAGCGQGEARRRRVRRGTRTAGGGRSRAA